MRVAIGCGVVIVLLMLSGIVYALVGTPQQKSPNNDETPTTIELAEAYTKGSVELFAKGRSSIDSFEISLTSKSTKSLIVRVLPGTVFTCNTPGVQSMIVVAEKLISLLPKERVSSIEVEAACINMNLSAPMRGHGLELSGATANHDLGKLVQLTDFQKRSFRIQQFAIWTITDNPPNAVDYMGISSGFSPFGNGPSQTDLDAIRGLFESAGIDTTRYYALGGK